ncbi:MAG: cobalamin-binding protein [Candidatus Neomarinimicrobiota bacterium]
MKKRVLSLLSSTTEVVYALGCEDQLVGRSHECDYPPAVMTLPICTKPKFNVDGSSKEVDGQVKSILQNALSVYYINEDLLKELKPDIIFTQSQCEVCAVSEKDVKSVVKNITGINPDIISVEPNSVKDIFKDIKIIAEALNVVDKGADLIDFMKNRIRTLKKSYDVKSELTVAAIEWIDPLMAAGNWVPELIEMAGGINLFGEAGKHSPWMEYKDLIENDPDNIIIMPCGYNIQKSIIEIDSLIKQKGWKEINAVQNDKVFITDGNQYFNRPGPRIIESLEILIEIFHNDKTDFKHIDSGWINFDSTK